MRDRKHTTNTTSSLRPRLRSDTSQQAGQALYEGGKKAFTLVELIVVVTILAILATIGFVSYSSYLIGVRDTNRLAQLVSIHDGLELYRTRNDLPLPDDNVEVQANSVTIAYQGYAGSNTLETIDFTKGGKDPKDGQYFSYYLTADRKYFQLMAFLEEEANITTQLNISDSVQAVDYSNRIPTVYGKRLGILTNIDNVPIQEVITTELDILVDDVTTYVAHLNDDEKILGSEGGLTLLRKAPLSNFDYGESLVGYWDMESIYSTDMLADMSGNGTHLGNQNSVTIGDNVDGAFISTGFNGVNQGFEKASGISSKLDLATDFSFSAWFFPESLASGGAYGLQNLIFTKGSLATVNYAIQITSQNSITFIERGLSQSLQHSVFSGLADMINKWTHIVVSINDGEIYLYMNGEFIEKKNIGAIEYQSNDPINIGGRGGVETFFDGYIDEVKVFNKALDISGVERLYEER